MKRNGKEFNDVVGGKGLMLLMELPLDSIACVRQHETISCGVLTGYHTRYLQAH